MSSPTAAKKTATKSSSKTSSKAATGGTAAEEAAYDAVPYESYAYPHTHPTSMHVVATLFGMQPQDFKKARVLELGCASGGNIFSQALLYPESHYHGIDISSEQIAEANRIKAELGVKNVTFEQADIAQFDLKKHKGKFDYIICHGVFSWVPDFVRDKILELCEECLAPEGLALVSYNTLPGWNAVRSVREMMLFHTNRFAKPQEKIAQAKALLSFLSENVPDGRTGYKAVIEEERKLLSKTNDSYIFHDHLEGNNAQFYLYQFAEMAGRHNLVYVGDSAVSSMFIGNMPPAALEALKAVNDIVSQEQYMDFITNRRFRNTILSRAGAKVVRNLDEKSIFNYYLSPMIIAEEGKIKAPITFTAIGSGGQFTANDDVGAALFLELIAAGNRPVHAEELIKRAAKRLGRDDAIPALRITLQGSGLKLALHGYIALHSDHSHAVMEPGEKPEIFKWARYLAAQPGCKSVTNMMHTLITSDTPANLIMTFMDGTRTRAQIVELMIGKIKDGTLNMQQEGKTVTDESAMRAHVIALIDQMIPRLAQQNLFVA